MRPQGDQYLYLPQFFLVQIVLGLDVVVVCMLIQYRSDSPRARESLRQPSISQILSGWTDLSDDQLDRLLSCMGYRLEVTRRPVIPELSTGGSRLSARVTSSACTGS
jgi:hypothetical protein